MRMLDLGTLNAAGAGTSFSTDGKGFLPGDTSLVLITSPDGAFAGSARVQTSPDGTTWTDVGPAAVVNAGINPFMVTLSSFIRLNVTSRSAGTVTAKVINEIG